MKSILVNCHFLTQVIIAAVYGILVPGRIF